MKTLEDIIEEIYNRALTLAEVTKNFNHGKGKHSN